MGSTSKSSSTTIELEHRYLLFDLQKLIRKWFLLRRDSTNESPDVQEIYHQIKNSITSILSNGLLIEEENQHRLLNELHWLHSCALRQDPLPSLQITTESTNYHYHRYNDKRKIYSIYDWISEEINDFSLCSKLQLLVSDKELLYNYYSSDAFLRNELYTTALFICISALELNQSSLLSQIDNSILNEIQPNFHMKHRRSSSHPQFSISSKKYSLNISKSIVIDQRNDNDDLLKENLKIEVENSKDKECLQRYLSLSSGKNKMRNNFSINRKWRSLPNIQKNYSSHRPRSKTMSQPISIPNNQNNDNFDEYNSQNQHIPGFDFSKINHSESTNSSGCMTNVTNIVTATTSTTSSNKTPSEINDLIPIQLVKCDDIKIYFDQSYNKNDKENFTTNNSLNNEETIISYDSPPQSMKINGLSPINLLSCMSANLFTSSDENLSSLKDHHPSSSSSNHKLYSSSGPSQLTINPNDFVSSFLPQEGEKLKNQSRRSYGNCNLMFDDDFLPDDTYYDIIDYNQHRTQQQSQNSPQILSGQQSLAAFLQTAQFSRNNTDLERENAHFKISEAMIALIEHMKWAKIERQLLQSTVDNNSNISNNNSNIRYKQDSSNKNNHSVKNSKRKNDELKIGTSSSSLTDKDDTESSNSENDDERHENTILVKNTNIEENYGSVENHVAYAEWGETNLDALSAEGVALSLISKFSDSQLPKASDLTWLVSEEDVPQELLPMPESPSANPDDHFVPSFTRGTRDWAPPRQQIIFTDHPPLNRKNHLQKQKYRCAGCGMKVALMYANRFRYCTYLGKYLCTGCHRNQISTIPAKVLTKWDFSYYPVCVFAYRLLEQMWTYPLFYIPDLNPSLYTKIKNLYTGKLRRIQLKYIQDFIKLCRFADKEQQMFENIPTHLTSDPDKWAMSDFVAVKNNHLQKYILELITKAEKHVFECMLCTARGFICELCAKDQIIYPWQSKVKRCDNCGSCFHQKCWNIKLDCVKCQRLNKRRQQLS